MDIQYEPSAPNVYRQYQDGCLSVNDFTNLISSSDRYRDAMQNTNNPELMVTKIGQAGYATDPDWPKKVINIMKQTQTQIAQVKTVSSEGDISAP